MPLKYYEVVGKCKIGHNPLFVAANSREEAEREVKKLMGNFTLKEVPKPIVRRK